EEGEVLRHSPPTLAEGLGEVGGDEVAERALEHVAVRLAELPARQVEELPRPPSSPLRERSEHRPCEERRAGRDRVADALFPGESPRRTCTVDGAEPADDGHGVQTVTQSTRAGERVRPAS